MERLRGVPLTDLAAIQRVTDVDPESILVNALNTWFGSVLACETFHADMCALQPTLDHVLCCFLRGKKLGLPAYPPPHVGVSKSRKACWSAGKSCEAACHQMQFPDTVSPGAVMLKQG